MVFQKSICYISEPSFLPNLNNFHSLEVVNRVSETPLQMSETSILWTLWLNVDSAPDGWANWAMNEWGFRPYVYTFRLNSASSTSLGCGNWAVTGPNYSASTWSEHELVEEDLSSKREYSRTATLGQWHMCPWRDGHEAIGWPGTVGRMSSSADPDDTSWCTA